VTVRQGDYCGTTVNLASRAVGLAPPGTIAVTRDFANHLSIPVPIEPLGPRRLKGFDTELDFVLLRP
jgi:class 3 adenylate cyclase